MLRSGAVRAAHVCSGFMVMGISMGAVLWRYPFQLDLLRKLSRVRFRIFVAWTIRRLLQARFSKTKSSVC